MKKKLEKRMYFLTMYNISPIQQGIQCGHAQNEYALKYWKDSNFQEWAKKWKTWIILNGGTSNNKSVLVMECGTMEQHWKTLLNNHVKHATFFEPDLNDSLTAIAFLVDERVFNKKDYPDFYDYLKAGRYEQEVDGGDTLEESFPGIYKKWLKEVGGPEVAFLKKFLKPFRMA